MDPAYREKVLPSAVRQRMSIEMGAGFGWERYVGLDGVVYSIDRFGASAPGDQVVEDYGFTAEKVSQAFQDSFK